MSTAVLNVKAVNDKKYLKEVEKENEDIIKKVEEIEDLINTTNNIFDFITDTELIDGLVYELNALHKKHSYYIRICKERGIESKTLIAGSLR